MRHRVRTNSLGRAGDQRDAMLKHLVRGLIEHGKVETTVLRAKRARPIAERLVTYGKRAQLAMQVASATEAMMQSAKEKSDASATAKQADALATLLQDAVAGMTEGTAKRNRAEQARVWAEEVSAKAKAGELDEAIALIRLIWVYGSGTNVALRRQARKLLGDEKLIKHLFEEMAPEYMDRNGGYTRITRTGLRRGDSAQKAVLEFVE